MSLCHECAQELSDEELATMLLEGKEEFLDLLYAKHSGEAKMKAWGIVRDDALAEDIVAEVFYGACEKISQLKDKRALKAWLFTSLDREALRQGKRRARTIPIEFIDPEGEKRVEVPVVVASLHVTRRDRPDVLADAKGLRLALMEALAELPEVQKLVAYRELARWGLGEHYVPTQQEMAELMGVSRDAYQRLRIKAIGDLRKALSKWRKAR